VVSASLGGALAPQIGSSVSLVSKQDIDDRSAQNALEVIRGVPGIEVSQAGRRGGVTGVYIRGGESKYNAILMDGIQLNDFGGSFDMASLPADGIERVEITRGPQSALYGSNAVTGVINIVSHRSQGRPVFTALAEVGSYATRRFLPAEAASPRDSAGLITCLVWIRTVVENDQYRNQSAILGLGYNQSSRGRVSVRNVTMPALRPTGRSRHFSGSMRNPGKQNLFGKRVDTPNRFHGVRRVTTFNLTTNDTTITNNVGRLSRKTCAGNNTRTEITISNRDTLLPALNMTRTNKFTSQIAALRPSWPRTSLPIL
jgi:outer membrane receptor protein involved in Fe transport